MVNEEKRTLLMSTQDNAIAIFLDQQSQRSSFSLIQTCLNFFLNENQWRDNVIGRIRIELPKIGVNLNYTLSNRYNGADLIYLFKEGLSLIMKRLSFNSNAIFLFSLVSTLKFSKDGECLQSIKWSLTMLPLGLTFYLVIDEILISYIS